MPLTLVRGPLCRHVAGRVTWLIAIWWSGNEGCMVFRLEQVRLGICRVVVLTTGGNEAIQCGQITKLSVIF